MLTEGRWSKKVKSCKRSLWTPPKVILNVVLMCVTYFMVRKIISVIEIWPLDAAYRNGVHPEKSFGFLFWLLSKNNWQIAVWPFKAATWSGVWPFLPFGFLSWTFLIINLHKDKCPFLAAQCNRVSPDSKKFLGFLSGRCSMINRQIGRSPFLAALYESIFY